MTGTPIHFRDVAATLAANGYRPVPIAQGKKYPAGIEGWERFRFQPGDEKNYQDFGAGILLGDIVGLDIDVTCPDACAAIETMVREVLALGDAAEIPRRIGQPPRLLLPCRCSSPFKKITTAVYRMRSCPEAKPSKVEILAEGQQFVAFHIHPDTGLPYLWNGGGDLLTVPRDQLPEITEAQAREIVREAKRILAEWGERIGEKSSEPTRNSTPGADIPEGERDDRLYRMGRSMHRARFDEPAILAALGDYNARHCKPPKEDDEVRRIAHSAATGEERPERRGPPLDLLRPMAAPPLSSDDVPAVLAEFATAQARASGFDVSILLAAGIAAACAALSDGVRLLVAPRSSWFESARLWLGIVGGPGAGKTPGSKAALAPVFAMHREAIGQWSAANKEKDDDERAPMPVLYVNDATTEALSDVLVANERGVLYSCDELESWLGQHDAYRSGGSKDRGEWLRLFDGGPHQVNRVKRGALFVPNWGVSLLSATTPAALRKLASKLPDDGLLQRFLLVLASPMTAADDAMLRAETRRPAKAWDDALRRLYAAPDCTVRLSPAASAALACETEELRALATACEDAHPAFASHVAKRPAMLARLALVFHALEAPTITADIAGETMERAGRFLRRQERHAHAVYGSLLGMSTGFALAKDIGRAILASRLDSFNRRELTPRCKAFRAADEPTRHAALTLLGDCGWLTVDAPTLGHGAQWLIDPRVHELFAEHGEAARRRRELVRFRILESIDEATECC